MDSTQQKLGLVVAYRNREEHLREFLQQIPAAIQHLDYRIVVVEQGNSDLFNRGMLLNVGMAYLADWADYFVVHDVDMMPEESNYTFPKTGVAHLSTYLSQFDYEFKKSVYGNFFGGICALSKEALYKSNGFSNGYWGWGSEDDDLQLRLERSGYVIEERGGRFRSLPHPTSGWEQKSTASIPEKNLRRLRKAYSGFIEAKADGMDSLKYTLIKKEFLGSEKIEKITVDIQRHSDRWVWRNALRYLAISRNFSLGGLQRFLLRGLKKLRPKF